MYNVKDYGGVPGAVGGCDLAISSALAQMDVDDPGRTLAKVLYFPGDPGPYYTKATVFVTRHNVTIRGDGRDVSRVNTAGGHHHMFLAGLTPGGAPTIPASPNGGLLDPNHYVDLYGKLDTSVTNGVNRAWGVRLWTDTIITFWSSGFDVPRLYLNQGTPGNWRMFPKLTINLCLDAGAGYLPAGTICGLGDSFQFRLNPWRLYISGTGPAAQTITFAFVTRSAPTTFRVCSFPITGATGIIRISFQIDLTTATFAAWVGWSGAAPTRVTVTPSTGTGVGGPSFTAADGLQFADNPGSHFAIGTWGDTGAGRNMGGAGVVMDLTIYGLCLCQDLLYDPTGAVGSAQAVHPARLATDGPAITDAQRYRRGVNTSSALIAQLGLTNNATTDTIRPVLPTGLGGRAVGYSHAATGLGGGYGIGLFQFTDGRAQANLTGAITGFTVEDISINASTWAGDAVAIGSMYDVTIRRSAFAGGRGLGSVHNGSCYWVTVEEVKFNASECCIHGYCTLFRTRCLEFTGSYNSMVYMIGCLFTLDQCFMNIQVTLYTFNFRYGPYAAQYEVTNATSDSEGPPFPEIAVFSVDTMPGFPSRLVVRDWGAGSSDTRCALVELLTAPTQQGQDVALSNLKQGYVDVRRCGFAENRVVVRNDSPWWKGLIDLDYRQDDVDTIEPLTSDGLTNLCYRTTDHPCPPSVRNWTPNCLVEPINPVRGLHRRYRPVTAGRYGTATPPVWEGEALIGSAGSELGAFSTSSSSTLTTITAGLFGTPGTLATLAPDWGDFTLSARLRILDYWLRGVAAAVPTALRLAVGWSIKNPIEQGVSATGVAVTGGFSVASGRVSTNPGPITFPLAVGDSGKAFYAVLLKDQANFIIWACRMPWQTPFGSSPTMPAITIAPGGIVVTGSAATGTSATGLYDRYTGGFTTYAWNAILDYWHSLVPLPAVPARYLGLSTGLANREGTVPEPSGSGYARVVLVPKSTPNTTVDPDVGSILLAHRGRSQNRVALTFPAATGSDWPEVKSVFLADAPSGGNVIWHANLVLPRTAKIGTALSFAPGALIFVM